MGILVLLLIYNVASSIFLNDFEHDIPNEVKKEYEEKGISGLDKVIPLATKIIVLVICLTVATPVILNKRKFLRGFEKAISPYNKKSDNMRLRRPTIKEGIIAILAFLCWYIFNDALNNHAGSVSGIYEVGVLFSNTIVKVLDFIWIGFFGSFFLMMILVMKNPWKRTGTTPKYDPIMGIFAIITYFLMLLIATVAQLTGVEPTSALVWFGGIAKSTIYHIGVIMFVISLLYYVITE